jgi:AcrR family transcriptional regulator
LDSAAGLILRWGYNKTTIDDIARQADVAKGTIYLHWKTREDLFSALVTREKVGIAEDVRRRIAEDTGGATLRAISKHSALALMNRPLMKAVLLRDMDIIGKLAHSENGSIDRIEKLVWFYHYLELLRRHGMVRSDMSMQEQVQVFSAVFLGFFMTAPFMPEGLALSDEMTADLLAETVHRTLEGDSPVSPDAVAAVSQAFIQYLDHALDAARQQLQRELE